MKEFTTRTAGPGVRLLVATALAGVMLVALGGLGYASSGGPSATAVEYQYGKKVTICHKGKTIRVSVNALKGHRRHGDTLGPCTAADRAKAKLEAKKAKLEAKKKAKLKAKKEQQRAQREESQRGKSDEHPGKGKGKK